MERTFTDRLVDPADPAPDRFFDRFVLNAHPVDGRGPCVIVGAGLYPAADVVDGFAIAVAGGEQYNLRFSTELSATDGSSVGPFAWRVVEPMAAWRVVLGPNPSGIELDLTWRARAPAWFGDVVVREGEVVSSSFEHLFQSGTYTGWVTIDGERHDADGWWGQRDRSRGVRTMSGGQGLHMWVQAQFPDRSVGFLLVEDRTHGRLLLEGAVMHVDGRLDAIVDVRHALVFDAGLDLRSGSLEVRTASGETCVMSVDASGRGGYMAGGGYGGHHGRPVGRDSVEHDRFPLDGTVGPATLDSALVDRLATFAWGDVTGTGIYEFAHTRSRSYTYAPSL